MSDRVKTVILELSTNQQGEQNEKSNSNHPYGQALWTMTYGNTDYIVGDIVLTGGTDSEGETLGLTPARIFYLKSVAVAISQMVEPQIVVY